MKKRMTSLLLVLAMCFAMLPTAAFAAENTQEPTAAFAEETSVDNWDGSADTSWYTSAPDASEYRISTAEQLAGLAQLVNADPGTTNFAGKTFYLDNDIDLSGREWISIGTGKGGSDPDYSFCGVFDGQGHVISNLYSHESYIEGADESHNLLRNALFGSVYNGEVKNLGVENADIWIDPSDDSAAGKGILVDWMGKSQITNCWTSGSIYSGTEIEKNIGGIVGVTEQGCTISGCYSTATLTGNFTNSEGYYPPDALPPDTIGGIVGARFDGSLTVTDCWFGGKIIVNSTLAAVGGIVGYTDTELGSATIKNCMVATTDIGVDNDGNTCWVAYALGGTVENCYWPNDEKAYKPSPLEADQGTAFSDFTSTDVLTGLQKNAGTDIEWVAGIKHPTFVWDDANIPADYTAVNEAIAAAEKFDKTLYSNYAAVEVAIKAVDRTKSKAEQSTVVAMAKAIEDAIAALQYKGADYTKVDAAIAKANALNKDNYKDFSAVEAAVKAVVRDKNITKQSEVDAMAKAIEDAINALVRKSSGGGSSSPSYSVTIPNKTENGTVTVSPRSAEKGDSVTITAKPDSGYQLNDLTVTDKNGKELKLTDKGNGKYTFTMPASKVTVTPTFVKIAQQPTGKTFVDVAKSDWFADAVAYVTDKGLMNGTGSDTFSPNASTTRGMLMTVLARYAGTDTTGSKPWYQKGMEWAKAHGVSDGTNPEVNITREQLVTMLYRYAGSPAASGSLDNFSDASTVSSYAVNAMQWAVANGIVNGSNGKLNPQNNATRAEVAAILMRFCEMGK
ncbi:S-layer homology domain-containing protein [Agathobaculum sp.]|uniref:S-layer homology domain-containing protein n=1 Tax=Agathobaculum sp. TaxID=2048138 RepID=UPI003AEF3086